MATSAKQKKKHLKAMHQKVKLFRAKEPVLSVFMWGVSHSINELRHISIPVMLMPDDFKAYSKVRIDNHLFNKENMPSHFKFKEYCPVVFRNLREKFDIDDEVYSNSLTKHAPCDEYESPGRSDARFMLTWDKQFVCKTITSEEVAEMHRIMEDYHKHIVERHGDTLLPQYLGMYRLTVNDNETYMVVTRNVFSPRLNIHKKYDLKGSRVDRSASDKEKAKEMPTYKDNDFVNDGIKIRIGPDAKDKTLNMLKADVQFLSKMNLMDYSLLVGIHDIDKAAEELNESMDGENGVDDDEVDTPDSGDSGPGGNRGGFPGSGSPPDSPTIPDVPFFSGELDPAYEKYAFRCLEDSPSNEIYFLAIIDILTHYGVKKRTASAAKTVKHGAGAEISTVKPAQYGDRFMSFVKDILS